MKIIKELEQKNHDLCYELGNLQKKIDHMFNVYMDVKKLKELLY